MIVKGFMSLKLKCYGFRLVIGTGFVCLIVCLVFRHREIRVQCKKRMIKEDLGRGELFQGAFKTIGKWSQERVYLLFNV